MRFHKILATLIELVSFTIVEYPCIRVKVSFYKKHSPEDESTLVYLRTYITEPIPRYEGKSFFSSPLKDTKKN